ncbi:MAG: signal peptidase I [Actinomycetota bacterium]
MVRGASTPAPPPRPEAAPVPSGARARSGWGRRIGVAATLCVVAGFLLATSGPRVLPYRVSYVRSGSMTPAVPVGALAVFRPAQAADLRPGDVIAFAAPRGRSEVIAHRIVGTEGAGAGRAFVTRGDANPAPDAWRVPARGTGWRQVLVVPYLGYGLAALTRPLVRTGLLVTVAGLGAVALLVALWRPERRTTRE